MHFGDLPGLLGFALKWDRRLSKDRLKRGSLQFLSSESGLSLPEDTSASLLLHSCHDMQVGGREKLDEIYFVQKASTDVGPDLRRLDSSISSVCIIAGQPGTLGWLAITG